MNISRVSTLYSVLFIMLMCSTSFMACKDKAGIKAKDTASDHAHKTESKQDKKDHKDDKKHEEMHEGHESMKTLPVEKRIVFMSGHVEAGLALYRAGAPDQAAQHLLHPVSETHKDERAGIDALGFTPKVFQAVSKALDEGKPASEIEPMLKQAESNMALMQKNAGGSPTELIKYLMDTVNEEYAVGVQKGVITDPGEYQDAYGFSVVALSIAKRIKAEKSKEVVEHLEALVKLWPSEGPLAKSTPKAVAEVVAQTAKVIKSIALIR